jgi:multidrug efflux pump subunit AcrB
MARNSYHPPEAKVEKFLKSLIRNRILVGLVVALILAVGVVTAFNINREAYPNVNFDMVSIKTIYPGGSPDEIEQLIAIPIEKKLREIDGMDKVRSYSIENVSVLVIYLDDQISNKAEVVQLIKDAVEQVDNLPSSAQKPIVEEIKLDKTNAIDVAITGKSENTTYAELRKTADELEDFIYEINGVAEVEDYGYLDREFTVEVNPEALKRNRIGINSIIDKLKNRNVDLPGGSIKVGDTEFVLRTKGQFRNVEEIRNTVVQANDGGFNTRIADLAVVRDTFVEPKIHERFNGKPAIFLTIWKKRSADEIKLVDTIRAEMEKFNKEHKDATVITLFNDTSSITRDRISSVLSNAVTGFILLAIIMMAMLGVRLATIVTTSIPLSFMMAFVAMKADNVTLNVISLFGMIMVLGMIVDNGIVVAENSHRYMEKGMKRIDAIERGVIEVFWPTFVTLLCLTAAFSPLLFMTGIVGKFVRAIPIVLIMCLVSSWIIAMFVIPTFIDIFGGHPNPEGSHDHSKSELDYDRGWFGKVQNGYHSFLGAALNHRYITLIILSTMLVASLGLIASGKIGFVFFPGGGAEHIEAKVKFPQETNLDANLREIRKLEAIILKLPQDELESLRTRVGMEDNGLIDPKPGEGSHKSTVQIKLTKEKNRKRVAEDINAQLIHDVAEAKKKGLLPASMQIDFKVNQGGPPIGKPVNVEIRGQDFEVIKKIAKEYTDYLKTIDGLSAISIDLEEGKDEFRYTVDEVMTVRSGISAMSAAAALNASYQGSVATDVRLGEEAIDVRVRFPESYRRTTSSLDEVMVANQQGGLIPLSRVTKVTRAPGYTQINRLNFRRLVQVQAELDTEKTTSMKVNQMLKVKFADIEKRYPNYIITYGGEQEDSNKSMGNLAMLFLFAIMVIYIILAVFFSSLLIPVVVMSAIPFALIGVSITLLLHGQPLSFMGTLGIFSLAGVIVSNTLVLVSFVHNLRDMNMPLRKALLEGGTMRLRPIILTSGTTVLGLFPTIYGLGGKDYFVGPLALTFGYGLIFGTIITLILIPSFYHIAEDFKGLFARIAGTFGIEMDPRLYVPECERRAALAKVETIPGLTCAEQQELEKPAAKKKPTRKK